jgi:hypothetical protein
MENTENTEKFRLHRKHFWPFTHRFLKKLRIAQPHYMKIDYIASHPNRSINMEIMGEKFFASLNKV